MNPSIFENGHSARGEKERLLHIYVLLSFKLQRAYALMPL